MNDVLSLWIDVLCYVNYGHKKGKNKYDFKAKEKTEKSNALILYILIAAFEQKCISGM